jgi:L-fucono-1,5-lactonase
MVIDAHQHFWKYNPDRDAWITGEMSAIRRDFLPPDLIPLLLECQVNGCMAVQADQSEIETHFLLSHAQQNAFVMGVVGWVDLCSPDISDRLAYFSSYPEIKGFRHIVQAEPDDAFMLRPDFQQGIAALKSYDLAYDILIYPQHLRAAKELVRKFPNQRFVVDHLAKPLIKSGVLEPWKKEIIALAELPNVFCKISGMVTEADWKGWHPNDFTPYLDVALEAFGSKRLLFGSDWPVCTVAASYRQQFELVKSFIHSLSAGEKAAIMGENAIQFYHI